MRNLSLNFKITVEWLGLRCDRLQVGGSNVSKLSVKFHGHGEKREQALCKTTLRTLNNEGDDHAVNDNENHGSFPIFQTHSACEMLLERDRN